MFKMLKRNTITPVGALVVTLLLIGQAFADQCNDQQKNECETRCIPSDTTGYTVAESSKKCAETQTLTNGKHQVVCKCTMTLNQTNNK